ncbi:phosphotransferase [Spongiibacter sp. KMU-158]|uniref:Phosphotransferase n=1 Tax=Spongiibacter pelagi TaxID=2760804 RepID=A0A927GUL8_9GAMM|nr:phosphotransferase [Spongiibacter pelagi]MBD2857480.1 phosphotransferase [Spongiibacter pelagi]
MQHIKGLLPNAVSENLRFLCVEVDSQLGSLQQLFKSADKDLAPSLINRSGYVFNLQSRIHNSALSALSSSKAEGPKLEVLRCVQIIASQLERISELARECARQWGKLELSGNLRENRFLNMLDDVRHCIDLIEPALEEKNSDSALDISRLCDELKKDYDKLHHNYIESLKQSDHIEDLTNALFIARNILQMAEVLEDISESILSSKLGQNLSFSQYPNLRDSARRLGSGKARDSIQLEPIAETRSGSAIAGVSQGEGKGYMAIFKEGQKSKVKEERLGVESWHDIYPGLAPKILSYQKRGKSAALLIEHLPGLTFEQILLHESPDLLDEALKQLSRTLKSVWQQTRQEKTSNAGFMRQLQKRRNEIYAIHPEFQHGKSAICGHAITAFDTLIEEIAQLETALPAPFSVYIHGDFNVDNIIYDPLEKRVNFIDLHRSRYMDYVQDVSVFMVSNYRLQILDAPLRRRILKLAMDFYKQSKRYAVKNGDDSFDLRLALGLARSFATSTRFILDKSLARSMFHRARYLMELARTADLKKPSDFQLPIKEIFVG